VSVLEEAAGETEMGLRRFPLLAGIAESDVERLEHFMARFEVPAGERLFRQGDASGCMYLIDDGALDLQVELTAGRAETLAQVGPGEVLGEISLLGGGARTATALAREPTSGWMLYRAAFDTLRIDSHAGSVELMARIAELAAARLRRRYEAIAAELGEPDSGPSAPAPSPGVPAAAALYTPAYLHSLLCFRAFHDVDQIAAAIGAAVPLELPRGSVLPSVDGVADLLLVLRGAVDVSIRRSGRARRVRLAGPGRFVGHVGVLDGEPSPVVAHACERVVLVALPGEHVRRMLRDASAAARRLTAAITADTARAVWQAERPIARTLAGI
jgi:CRP-like cAMP-binding protein